MKAQQNILSHEVAKLEENFHSSSCSSSPAASRKVKNRVTRDLTVSCDHLIIIIQSLLSTSLHRTKLQLYTTVWKKGLRCVKGTLFYPVFD